MKPGKIQIKIYDDTGRKVYHADAETFASLPDLMRAASHWLGMWASRILSSQTAEQVDPSR